MKKPKPTIIFDLSGTLVKMRPATLLVSRVSLTKLSRKFQFAILTGARRTETLNIITKLNLVKFFPPQRITTQDDSTFRKPNPLLLVELIKKVKSDIVFYIGDSSKDYNMCKELNIDYININLVPKDLKL